MTIRRGEAWGEPGVLPAGAPIARTDAEVTAAIGAGASIVGVLGGDLCRSVGGGGDVARLTDGDGVILPVDVGWVAIDDQPERPFVAHVVVRGRTWWRRPVAAVMNAQYIGAWDVAPRSHPNDGRLDVVEADLSTADRWKARRRLPTGAHVPHPGIAERRVREVAFERPRPTGVWVDGVSAGRGRRIRVRVQPDAFHVVV